MGRDAPSLQVGWSGKCNVQIIQSWAKTFLLSSENHPQNVPQPTQNAIFQAAMIRTWQECFALLCISSSCLLPEKHCVHIQGVPSGLRPYVWLNVIWRVPMPAEFCMRRRGLGRIGWAVGQDVGTSKSKSTQPRSQTGWNIL